MSNAESPRLREKIVALGKSYVGRSSSLGTRSSPGDGDEKVENIENRLWKSILANTKPPPLRQRPVQRVNESSVKRERSESMHVDQYSNSILNMTDNSRETSSSQQSSILTIETADGTWDSSNNYWPLQRSWSTEVAGSAQLHDETKNCWQSSQNILMLTTESTSRSSNNISSILTWGDLSQGSHESELERLSTGQGIFTIGPYPSLFETFEQSLKQDESIKGSLPVD